MFIPSTATLRLVSNWVDYLIIALYFCFVLGIGIAAKRSVSSSIDFFLSGRSLPAWITGLAFISANLGATEILGMAANGAQIGMSTLHYYLIGAVPAMVFLGLVMMPFYYASRVRRVPEILLRRIGADWLAIVLGLGFVLSFGYWTTNFTEVQRAFSAKNMSAARRTPLIGAFPKLLIPFIVVVPGLIGAAVLGKSLSGAGHSGLTYNSVIPKLMQMYLPSGVLGV